MPAFPKTFRLRKRREYLAAQSEGSRVNGALFLALVVRHPREPAPPVEAKPARIGITVSGKVGPAVVRNRLKRWVREYVRHHAAAVSGRDVVIIARAAAAEAAHADVDRDLTRLLRRCQEAR